ncbi:pentatricopeptide repeat-containing protein At2g20540 isoform X1 [Sesamum indicum]|uniref:Pentatricopeptide repeat-containing protein At2g20540 isoform X1 n=1 Tax=Sesamum indicum TaxID=4182 RepID=A0A8M8VDP1_SESIN|nr:pentatricopeptide repeat-containing protein At2g20540 isoform X1 [Sesamum indicum]
MLLKNLFHRGRIMVLQHLRESLLPFFLCKAVNYSLQTNSSNWVHHNQLFQRHQRLQLLEEQCNRTFSNLKQLLSYVFVSGLHRNPFVMSRLLYLSLIELRGSNGTEKLEFGVEIFNQIGQPNLFSWNTMIRFFAVFDPVIALNYYKQMLSREMVPDRYTFPFVLQACGAGLDLGSVKQVHCHIVKLVLDHDLFVQNSLLNAYIICCSDADAWSVFNEMPEKDIVSWTSLISGLVSQCSYCDALYLFKTLLSDDCQPQPNVVTVVSTMSACASLGSMDLTKCFHALLDKAGWLEFDVSVVNSLIDAYAKCGDLCCARKVFEDIENILSACAHSGLVEEGLYIFELMSTKYGIQPDLRHYGCIVDILARAGMVYRAYNIVENMPMEPNLAVLGSLLSGCRLHNNLEFGEAVLRKIELLKDRGGGAPVLLSNMYADENQWSKVIHLRKEMRVLVQGKPPGRSWI